MGLPKTLALSESLSWQRAERGKALRKCAEEGTTPRIGPRCQPCGRRVSGKSKTGKCPGCANSEIVKAKRGRPKKEPLLPARQCVTCGKDTERQRAYCSEKCQPDPINTRNIAERLRRQGLGLCLTCGKEFNNSAAGCGRTHYCSDDCRPNRVLRNRKYRKTRVYSKLDKHSLKCRLFEEQEGLCAICPERGDSPASMCLDHDHVTGKARGLLCSKCNSAFGFARESPDIIRALLYYAVRHYRAA